MKAIFGRELDLRCVLAQEKKRGEVRDKDLVQEAIEFFGPGLVEERKENPEL